MNDQEQPLIPRAREAFKRQVDISGWFWEFFDEVIAEELRERDHGDGQVWIAPDGTFSVAVSPWDTFEPIVVPGFIPDLYENKCVGEPQREESRNFAAGCRALAAKLIEAAERHERFAEP